MPKRIAAIAAAAVILIGGAITAFALTRGSRSTLSPANQLVCRHYLAQRRWFLHLTYPNLGDALKFTGYIAADSGAADGKLKTDLDAMSKTIQGLWDSPNGRSGAYDNSAARVLRDCTS